MHKPARSLHGSSWKRVWCQVVEVSPLLRELLLAAVDIDPATTGTGATPLWSNCSSTNSAGW